MRFELSTIFWGVILLLSGTSFYFTLQVASFKKGLNIDRKNISIAILDSRKTRQLKFAGSSIIICVSDLTMFLQERGFNKNLIISASSYDLTGTSKLNE